MQSLVSRGELYDDDAATEKIESPEERADATIILVSAARKKGDAGLARDVLQGTQKLLAGGVGSASQARAYLWLASSYSTIDGPAGFELMAAASSVLKANSNFSDRFGRP